MTIIKTKLITAFSCRIDGKKNITVINGSRNKGSWVVADKPSKLEIDFREVVEHIDITFVNYDFKGEISLGGMGLAVKNIMPMLPELQNFTYRFIPPKKETGKIIFETKGGSGSLSIVNVSGFTAEKI